MPATSPAQTPRMCTSAIPLRRSFLRYRPSAPPRARAYGLPLRNGAAQTNRCEAPHRALPYTRRANNSCPASCCRPFQKYGNRCSASGNNRGGFAPAALLKAARYRSLRSVGAEPGRRRKRCAFLPQAPRVDRKSGSQAHTETDALPDADGETPSLTLKAREISTFFVRPMRSRFA